MPTRFAVGLLALITVVAGHWSGVRAEEDAKAASIMAEARKALGGERTLAALKGLSVRAEFRREMETAVAGSGGGTFVMMRGPGGAIDSSGQVGGSIEIDVVFPDKFYRMESTTSGIGLMRVDGFEGNRPFMDITSNNANTRVMIDRPNDDPERSAALLKRTNTDLARLLLGMIGSTQPGMRVSYTYAGQAESPDGTAHVIDVSGRDEFRARLFVDTTTHLPLMLTFSEPEPRVVRMTSAHGVPPAGGTPRTRTATSDAPGRPADLTPEERAEIDKQTKAAEEAPRKMIDYRLFFSDYREVDGISLPHRIVRGTGDKTIEEWDIKNYKVNPTIKDDRFKVGTE